MQSALAGSALVILADTDAFGLAGIVFTFSVNAAFSRLSITVNLRLVKHLRRVKWTKHTGFPDVEIAF
jgi:hypothetical protein